MVSPHAHNGTLNIHQHTLYTHTHTWRWRWGQQRKGRREDERREGRRNARRKEKPKARPLLSEVMSPQRSRRPVDNHTSLHACNALVQRVVLCELPSD